MHDLSADPSAPLPVPPPVHSRAVPAGPQPAAAPLMPPFVHGRSSIHALRAAHALASAPEIPHWATPASAPAPPQPVAPVAHEPMPWEEPAPPARDAAPGDDGSWPTLLEEGSAEPAWDNGEEISGGPAEFPLDAFIIPEDSQRLPSGYEAEHDAIAERVASRLDELARQVRARGLPQLGAAPGADELSRLIAAVVAGYVGRGGDA